MIKFKKSMIVFMFCMAIMLVCHPSRFLLAKEEPDCKKAYLKCFEDRKLFWSPRNDAGFIAAMECAVGYFWCVKYLSK